MDQAKASAETPLAARAERVILGERVVSKPGAIMKVVVLQLSEASKALLRVGPEKLEPAKT